MRLSILTAVLFTSSLLNAQTGPGGVGTTADLVLWLAADRSITMSGGKVHVWGDASGNGNNATGTTTSVRPDLVAGAVNGYPAVDFDGVNDELSIPQQSELDLWEWDAFLIGAVDGAKNNNAWFSKGTNTTTVNYGMWGTSTNACILPIRPLFSSFSGPSTPASTFASSFTLIEYYHNWLITELAVGRRFLKSGVSTYTSSGFSLPPSTYNAPLRIGNATGASGWHLDGKIAELILFNAPRSATQRIIVNNYLSAKYDLPLNSGNVYRHDEALNGHYDHDVAGIGHATGSTAHPDSRGTGVVRISGASDLGANEFLFWGHDNGLLGAWSSTDYPAGMQGRWHRVWRVNETNISGTAVDVGSVNMDFDLTSQGPVTAADLRLLVDTDGDGLFADETPIAGATALGSDIYRFTGVADLMNNRRFTLGTTNMAVTPLPVELLHFTANELRGEVLLSWATASEQDNDHFTVERSADLMEWSTVLQMPGAGNSTVRLDYTALDQRPLTGTSYYRLRQTDNDGASSVSRSVPVSIRATDTTPPPFPNPATDAFTVLFPGRVEPFDLVDVLGRPAHPVMVRYQEDRAVVDVSALPAGTYMLRFADGRAGQRVQVVRP